MTGEQYDALVKLMRGRPDSPANRAARQVLVEGVTQAQATRASCVEKATVNQAVSRYRNADRLIRDVYGIS
jgi:hypothetical protein